MSKLSKKLAEINFIKYGFCQNYWLWAHMVIAGILTRGFLFLGVKNNIILYLMTFLIILFEIVESAFENEKEVYGTIKKSIYDRWGDILGALCIVVLILY